MKNGLILVSVRVLKAQEERGHRGSRIVTSLLLRVKCSFCFSAQLLRQQLLVRRQQSQLQARLGSIRKQMLLAVR